MEFYSISKEIRRLSGLIIVKSSLYFLIFYIQSLFIIPKTEEVNLTIYDILGGTVVVLIDDRLMPGSYEIEWNAVNPASGVYLYQITAGKYKKVRKMLLVE